VAAPIRGPDVAVVTTIPSDVGTEVKLSGEPAPLKVAADATKPSYFRPMDSGDEFVQVRPRKRRALRLVSSDEDSQSVDAAAANLAPTPAISDNSCHPHCENSSANAAAINTSEQSATTTDIVTEMVADQPPVAMEAKLAPPIHRLSLSMIGHLESLPRGSRMKLQVRMIWDDMQEIAVAVLVMVSGNIPFLKSW